MAHNIENVSISVTPNIDLLQNRLFHQRHNFSRFVSVRVMIFLPAENKNRKTRRRTLKYGGLSGFSFIDRRREFFLAAAATASGPLKCLRGVSRFKKRNPLELQTRRVECSIDSSQRHTSY